METRKSAARGRTSPSEKEARLGRRARRRHRQALSRRA